MPVINQPTATTGLTTATTTVDTSAAAAPTTGQVLTATSANTATWQTPATATQTIPAFARAVGTTSAPTTTSATFATLAEMTVTLTTTGANPILVNFTGTFQNLRNDDARFQIFVDGTGIGTEHTLANANNDTGTLPLSISELATGLSAGSHTITLRWRRVGGTARAVGTARVLVATEVI